MLLSEVAPVITLGRRTPETDLLWSPSELAARGVSILRTDRGGLATYHGPGQWLLFLVERLDRITGDSRGIRRAIEGLLHAAARAAATRASDVTVREGCETGVWSSRGKIASVGVHVQDRFLLHGVAINGFRTETSFLGLRPCGMDAQVDYLIETSDPMAREREFMRLGQDVATSVLEQFWGKKSSVDASPRLGL